MAPEHWDVKSRQLTFNSDIIDPETVQWIGEKPDDAEAYETFLGLLQIDRNSENGLLRVSIKHQSPELAQKWVGWLVSDINEQLRLGDIAKAESSIEYLKQQLQQTAVANMQQVLYQMIENQIQTMMLANVRQEYAFKVIDPPVENDKRVSPNRSTIVFLTLLISGVVSVMGVLLFQFFRRLNFKS
jgi:LPS O-antigen subunit length determinant protein (WzzB/FepE family)